MHSRTRCYSLGSPLGNIYIYSREDNPVRISIAMMPRKVPLTQAPPPPRVMEIMEAIRNYFSGKDIQKDIVESLLASAGITTFQKKVYGVVAGIPRGQTLSYGEVAARAGNPRAARAVGNAMRRNPFPLLVPCHRVIKTDGSLGGYSSGGAQVKARLLDFERAE